MALSSTFSKFSKSFGEKLGEKRHFAIWATLCQTPKMRHLASASLAQKIIIKKIGKFGKSLATFSVTLFDLVTCSRNANVTK